MVNILDWIFEGIANWLASIVTSVMDAISALFLNALGTNMTTMEEYFPFVTRAFEIMQYTAWALLFLITIWQLFRAFGGPITDSENPWHLLIRSAIFAFMIAYAKQIFSIALDIARAPYTALMDASMSSGDFTFAGVWNTLGSGLVTLISVISIVGLLLQLILMIALGWNYFKLLLEVVERYVVVGVLCYTSPLAFAMGGSKATSKVFQSWCRMIGSQLLLLVMNVWFLRAFNSSVGQFAANGGALSTGQGNIFLWMFCALAFLKTAQKFDSYLASLGLSVAQTGSGMGMEMLMGIRLLTGLAGGGARSAGSMFRGGGATAGVAGAAGAAGAGGFMAGLASKFKGNSFVRDAVVEGGSRMGAGGSIGFVGRAFGGMAARSGATLSGDSISSVASRPSPVSGSIAGAIADRSLKNYMPHLAGTSVVPGTNGPSVAGFIPGGTIRAGDTSAPGSGSTVHGGTTRVGDPAGSGGTPFPGSGIPGSIPPDSVAQGSVASDGAAPGSVPPASSAPDTALTGIKYSDTQITGGHISTTATTADGSTASVDLYNTSQYDRPSAPHSVVTASDGSQWYQIASGDGMGAFYQTPAFSGDASEAAQVSSAFPTVTEGTTLRTVENGVIEASHQEGGSSLWYNSAYYTEPEAPHSMIQGSDGVGWYAMQPHASQPEFETTPYTASGDSPRSGAHSTDYDTASGGGLSDAAMDYNRAQFQQFMPAYEQRVSQVDASRHADGMIEVRHTDGSGTAFYDRNMYQMPRGEHRVYEDSRGSQWYGVPGTPTVERRPVYDNGKPVYDGEHLRTVNTESIRYKTTPTKFDQPKKRDFYDRKPPNPKKK